MVTFYFSDAIQRFSFEFLVRLFVAMCAVGIVSGSVSGQELINEDLRDGALPSGWSQTDVSFQTAAGGYARFDESTSVLTTPTFDASANTSVDLTFHVAKWGSGEDGPLTIEYSLNGGSTWTVQGNSFIPEDAVYLDDTISIPTTSGTMQIRFTREDSPSRKRLRDVLITGVGTSCTNPSQMVFTDVPTPVLQSEPFSLQVELQCSNNSLSNCNEGTVTLNSTACGLEGTLTQPVVNGVANFSNLVIVRSLQEDANFTAVYSGGCGSLTATSVNFDVLEPIPGGVLAQQNYDDPSTWDSELTDIGNQGFFSSSNNVGYSGSGLAYFANSCSPSGVNQSISTVTYFKSGLTDYSGLKFKFRMAVRPGAIPGFESVCSGGAGIDQNENIELHASVNGGAFVRTFIVNGFSDGNYPFDEDPILLNHNSNTSYDIQTQSPSNFTISLPANTDNVSFRFTLNSNRATEVIILDNLMLEAEEGTNPSPLPIADVGSDYTGCNGGPNDLSVGVTDAIGAVTYEWSPAASISGSTTGETASANNTTTQTYTVTATDEDGCAATDQVTVNIPSGPAGTWTNDSGNDSWFECRNWADGKVPDTDIDVTIPTGSSDPIIDDDANNALCADLNIGANRALIAEVEPGYSLEVHGNISGSGAIDIPVAYLIFAGNQPQTISAETNVSAWALEISKPSNHVVSETNIDLNCDGFGGTCGSVDLNSGVLKMTESAKLIVGNGTAISEGSETSFVDGIIHKKGYLEGIEVIFPTGVLDLGGSGPGDDLLIYQPASLIASADDETAIFEVQYFHENYNELIIGADPFNPDLDPTLDKVSTCNYWDISRTNGSLNVRVGLSWDEAYCHEIEDPTNLAVAYYYDLAEVWGQTSTGSQPYNTADPYTTGWVKTDGPVTSFSPFTIGSIGSDLNVLPIELLWFDAERLNPSVVKTNWATAAEINNDFFTVERSSDGIHFVEIGEVPGAGNSNSEINYRFDDDGASPATTYYRLKQTDYDGTFTYSNVVAVGGTKDRGQLEITRVHNGASGLEVWHTRSQTPLIAEVFDLTGKRLLVKQVDGGSSRFVLHPQIARGIYFVRLSAEGEYDTAKFFY